MGESEESDGEFFFNGGDDGAGGGDGGVDADGAEDGFVAWVVDACDDAFDAEAVLCDLADGEVGLVASGSGDDDVGAVDAGGALDVDFGAVADEGDFAEFVFDGGGGGGFAFDDADFVVAGEEVSGGAPANFAAADDDDVHGCAPGQVAGSLAVGLSWSGWSGSKAAWRTSWSRTVVGSTTRMPSCR